ncbi:hypothetical protein Hanom_Chr01g00021381 [Helianthus anomalus]
METNTKTQLMSARDIEEMVKKLPQHTPCWLKGKQTLYNKALRRDQVMYFYAVIPKAAQHG